MNSPIILGFWDGHDSGAAIIKDNKILFAINEERLTRRKLEVCFPEKSIQECLNFIKVNPNNIEHIATSTSDFAKTLTRLFPSVKEEYYLIRRRKKEPDKVNIFKKRFKYRITEFGSNKTTRFVSEKSLKKHLKTLGFEDFHLHIFDHHLCHVAGAAFCSGFDQCLAITIDGLGDGLSGTINTFKKGKIIQLSRISAKSSLGIFFEHVTNLLNMRELEDEGKVMALANYGYPINDKENPLLDFFTVDNLTVSSKYSTLTMHRMLKKILWYYPSEQFAYMAQRTLEQKITQLVRNAIRLTNFNKIAISGGVVSNIKVNMLIKNLPEVEDCFVFPHMGDGGLALGAALLANYKLSGFSSFLLEDVALGPSFKNQELINCFEKNYVHYQYFENIEQKVAQLIIRGNIVLWFQDRMEMGPRALGNRSILARPDSLEIKDQLNIKLKKRVWYQPFCPSMLEGDARELFLDYKGTPNKFMTMGYMVKPEKREHIKGVINIDGSCRPQILKKSKSLYYKLLLELKKLTGLGVVLNTSFNIHGEPMVCTPTDAIRAYKTMKVKYLVIDHFLITGLKNE